MEDLNQLRPEQESGAKKPASDDVDALLQDVKSLLGETDADIAAEAPAEPDAEDSEPITADDVQIDYGKFYGPEEPGQSKTPLTYYEQSKPAYQRARRAEYERVREQERLARAERQQALSRDDTSRVRQARTGKKHEKPRKNAAEYAEWLYSQGLSAEEQQARQEQEEALAAPAGPGPQKAGEAQAPYRPAHPRRAGASAGDPDRGVPLPHRQPAGGGERPFRPQARHLHHPRRRYRRGRLPHRLHDARERRPDGKDHQPRLHPARYAHLLRIFRPEDQLRLRLGRGREQGMQELLLRVSEIIGFTPDGYIVVDLSIFRQLVDLMGGVTFDVPVDMHYSDPTQNLSIDLQAGKQRLNGEQAMQVARFRSGYATADLGRIEVQRSLVSAAIRQWVSPKGAIHLPQAVKLVADHTNTDLSTRNLLWLAESFLLCSRSDINSATLPGYAANFSSGSYYVLDAAGVADIVNQYLNPYEKGVEAADLFIRNG
ncbi:MAG: LCP family protein [Oscillospiraceae bacterium]